MLTLIDYYLPGYKAGGSLRMVANVVDQLSDEYEFLVVTRNRDLGDSRPYATAKSRKWIEQGHARVMYLGPPALMANSIRRLLRSTRYDILWLNSFFSPFMTLLPLALRRAGMAPTVPIVVAPQGEFSPGALGLRASQKAMFIRAARLLSLYRDVTWKASSDAEALDIRRQMRDHCAHIVIAPDLVQRRDPKLAETAFAGAKSRAGPLRMIFLSRVAPKKNLSFLLKVLSTVRHAIDLAIVGPHEDADYWAMCERQIEAMPNNVRVTVSGHVPNHEVGEVLASHDLFALPTLGENFGHVVVESLSVGTPVLVSDRTPWKSDDAGAVEALPLEEVKWQCAIQRWSQLDRAEVLARRVAARGVAERYVEDPDGKARNRAVFEYAIAAGAAGGRTRSTGVQEAESSDIG